MKKLFWVMIFSLAIPASALAAETASGDYFSEIGTKFGRGIENIVTSPAEIPCTIETEMHKGDRILRFFSGLGKGTIFFTRRVILGATEVVTFAIPMERTLPRVCEEEPVGVIG